MAEFQTVYDLTREDSMGLMVPFQSHWRIFLNHRPIATADSRSWLSFFCSGFSRISAHIRESSYIIISYWIH
jgi:hypothetical protein